VTEIRSTVRAGRFTRQERLEDDGRIQSWVLAGERGVVEARGARPDEIYYLVHKPALPGEFDGGHTLLVLVNPEAFPESECTVLEGPCNMTLLSYDQSDGYQEYGALCALDVWAWLEDLYRRHLDGKR
jgi:hypothetical protein